MRSRSNACCAIAGGHGLFALSGALRRCHRRGETEARRHALFQPLNNPFFLFHPGHLQFYVKDHVMFPFLFTQQKLHWI